MRLTVWRRLVFDYACVFCFVAGLTPGWGWPSGEGETRGGWGHQAENITDHRGLAGTQDHGKTTNVLIYFQNYFHAGLSFWFFNGAKLFINKYHQLVIWFTMLLYYLENKQFGSWFIYYILFKLILRGCWVTETVLCSIEPPCSGSQLSARMGWEENENNIYSLWKQKKLLYVFNWTPQQWCTTSQGAT